MIEELIKIEPLVHKNDTLQHIRKLMNRFFQFEFPVIDNEYVVGIINTRDIIKTIRKVGTENLLAKDVMQKEFLKFEIKKESEVEVVKKFVSNARHYIGIFFENNKFFGYLPRIELLKIILKDRKCVKKIEDMISYEYRTIDFDSDITELIKLLDFELPVVVIKDGKPIYAFSVQELYFLSFVNYLTQKKYVVNRRILRELKYQTHKMIPPLTVEKIIAKPTHALTPETHVIEAANLMSRDKKIVLPVFNGKIMGIITDIKLLEVLI